jgi:hypothetical protein
MSETGVDLGPVNAALARLGPPGRGRRLGVFEAEADQGAAALARDLLRACIEDNQAALLADIALDGVSAQAQWFERDGAEAGLVLGPARDGRLRGQSFVQAPQSPQTGPSLAMRQIGQSRAFLIHPRAAALSGARQFQPDPRPSFWSVAGEIAALTVVNAPPICQAPDGLHFAGRFDGVVLVVSAQTGSVRAAMHAARQLSQARAGLLGIVYTNADPGVLALEQAWPIWAA